VKPKLPQITMQSLRSHDPCYDPVKYLPETFSGTALDILRHRSIPPKDKTWAVLRSEYLSDKLLRLFAVQQARTCRKYIPAKERAEFDRILKVVERFAKGKATDAERIQARSDAWAMRYAYAAAYAAYAAAAAYAYAAYAAAAAYAYARTKHRAAAVKTLTAMVVKEYARPKKVSKK
jgi:hypothetical protein